MHRIVIPLLATLCLAQETRQATGVKVGEVTGSSAMVWMRVTAKPRATGRASSPAGARPMCCRRT